MKFVGFFAVAMMVFSLIATPTKAVLIDAKRESSITLETGIVKQTENIIFTKFQRNQGYKTSNEKYAAEFAYYFHKESFKQSPVSYLLFENGDVIVLNPDWQVNHFNNNLNKGVLFVGLVYEDNFSINNFLTSLTELKTTIKDYVVATNITSIESLEQREFSIEKKDNITFLDQVNDSSTSYIRSIFTGVDYTNKASASLRIESIEVPAESDPNTTIKAKVKIKNDSKFTYLFTSANPLQLSFEKDSTFFVNGKWLNQRIIFRNSSDYIKGNSVKAFEIELHTGLIPESTKENIILMHKGTAFDTKIFDVKVKDVGQKILRVKPTETNYLNVRKESKAESPEIGRATVGKVYIYSELQNNYYKIDFNGQPGWVAAKYVEILK